MGGAQKDTQGSIRATLGHMFTTLFLWLFTRGFQFLNDRVIPWHKLPWPLGLLNLIAIRQVLRESNLYDVSPVSSTQDSPAGDDPPRDLTARTPDGKFNDLGCPAMGSAGTGFGHNIPLDQVRVNTATFLTPNPREISRKLLIRNGGIFHPAATLNLLAAAWIQFMAHDWFSHGENEEKGPINVRLEANDPWLAEERDPERKNARTMEIKRTRADRTRSSSATDPSPTFVNTETHWWDGSQIYGSNPDVTAKVRWGVGGKLTLGQDGLLPVDKKGIDISGVTGNWWVGLSLLHTLFTLEHNAICDRLRAEYPAWPDDDLFSRARLINVALMAKIHTVEWTPAILDHPAVRRGMRGNWWGLLGERVKKNFGRVCNSETLGEILSGIPGSRQNHHQVPYSITEEFVAVYRLHPLMPDEIPLRFLDDPVRSEKLPLSQALAEHTREVIKRVGMRDLLYSFGIAHPGALVLHNYPRSFERLQRANSPTIDLATVDILRDRERGVPRYNTFRELLHLPRVKSFEELTENKMWAEELRCVYKDEIEDVDLLVGLLAEPRPKGFGLGDTAFRIFILLASRRLKSDRFFTTDYTPRVYTQTGLDWIDNTDMATVLLRHFPDLGPELHRVDNVFKPWRECDLCPAVQA